MAKSGKKGRLIILIAGIVVVLAAGWVVRSRLVVGDTAGAADSTAADSTAHAKGKDKDGKEKKEDPLVPVEIATAGNRTISSYYVTTATLEAERKVDVLTKIAGEVVEVIAEEGDVVEKGALLVRLDDREPRIALEEARINREQQRREVERLEAMRKQDLVSEKEYGDLKHLYDLAENAYQSALLRYEYTKIRAPFAGVVTERLVDSGESVGLGAKLYVVADTDPLQLTMFIPEGEMRSIDVGQKIEISPSVHPEMTIDGAIIRVAPEVDLRTGTVKVTAEANGGGIPGSFVRVKVVTDTRNETLTIPRRGIVADAGDHFVFIAAADTVRKVEVEVGYEDADYAEIVSGIALGDTVVTAGVGAMREGTKIKILNKDAAEVTEAAKNK